MSGVYLFMCFIAVSWLPCTGCLICLMFFPFSLIWGTLKSFFLPKSCLFLHKHNLRHKHDWKKPVKYSILLIVKYSILFSNTLWLFRSFLQLWELSSLVIKAHFSSSGCYYKSADSFHSSSFPKVSSVRSVGSFGPCPSHGTQTVLAWKKAE